MKALRAPLAAAAAWLGSAVLPGQVVINEINFTVQQAGDDQWVELVNLTSNKTDLSTWSLYQATKTASQPGNYWFGFPPGTEIAPFSFLRVHWNVPVKPSTATDIYTGNTVFHFLFGYGAESISKLSGAFALVSTQQNLQMNFPGVYVDWVQWGATGFLREDIAVAAGRWVAGNLIPSPTANHAIALDRNRQAEPTPSSAFFRDGSPTPGTDNIGNAAYGSYGTSCSSGSIAPLPFLDVLSIPALGNADFGLRVGNSKASQQGVLFFSVSQNAAGFPIFGCNVWVGVPEPIIAQPITMANGVTNIPLPLLSGTLTEGTVFLQVIIAENLDLAFTQGLAVSLGG